MKKKPSSFVALGGKSAGYAIGRRLAGKIAFMEELSRQGRRNDLCEKLLLVAAILAISIFCIRWSPEMIESVVAFLNKVLSLMPFLVLTVLIVAVIFRKRIGRWWRCTDLESARKRAEADFIHPREVR